MSKINIARAVANIRPGTTTVYTPLVEIVVNSIQAIEEKNDLSNGRIEIAVERQNQLVLKSAKNEMSPRYQFHCKGQWNRVYR